MPRTLRRRVVAAVVLALMTMGALPLTTLAAPESATCAPDPVHVHWSDDQ
jgi:hypothetical protein